jgi:hypothetical protein
MHRSESTRSAVSVADATRGRRVVEPSPDSVVVKTIGPVIGVAIGWLIGRPSARRLIHGKWLHLVFGLSLCHHSGARVDGASGSLFCISLRWSLPLGRADAYQHMVPSWPGAFRVQDGHPPWLFCSTAAADGKHKGSCPLPVESRFPCSDNICDGFASVGLLVAWAGGG